MPARLPYAYDRSMANRGTCRRCGGQITATHMLTRMYAVSADGRWQRRLDEFDEDVVVVCSRCNDQPAGELGADEEAFWFEPADEERKEREP